MIADQPLTSVIVPAWRGGRPPAVAAFVRGLAETTEGPWELIVVCNGQDPGLADYVRTEPAVTRAAFLTQNSGVARGWNIGAHLALGDCLVFANEDVVPGPGCIDGLVAALRATPDLGLVGPRGARWEFGPAQARHVEYVSGDGLVPCDVVSGFLFAMPRETVAAAGYFDDELAPCSYEEIDMAQAVRRLGRSVCALGGLQYAHDWGVSTWDGGRQIAWLGRSEPVAAINLRNQARVVRKWGTGRDIVGADFLDGQCLAPDPRLDTTGPRTARGSGVHAETAASVIEATGLLPHGGRILHLGCARGLLVEELVRRGYDARGLDHDAHAVRDSAVRDRLRYGRLLELPAGASYDVVFAGGLYEQLNDAEARLLTQKIRAISSALVAVIGKSRGEPAHVNIKSNRRWLRLFADCGFGLELGPTCRARAQYLRTSPRAGAWHLDLLALSTRAHALPYRLARRVAGDGAMAWRIAGAAKGMPL